MMKLSIIICTINRSRLLKKCLDSLILQLKKEIEVIVIDNNSTDTAFQLVEKYSKEFNNINVIVEKKVGLSHARNRGIIESKSDWILYVDDDAIAFPDLVERALYLVERKDFDCVGGMYFGYFEGEKPKWLNSDYGTKVLFSNELQECPFNVPHGGIVLYKKSSILSIGGFDPNFGMVSNKIRFGEEVNLQKRLFENGYRIGFDPYLKINHLNKRTNVTDQLIINFKLGKSHKYQYSEKLILKLYKVLRSIVGLITIRIPKNLFNIFFKQDYYWQNSIIDTFGPTLYFLGKI